MSFLKFNCNVLNSVFVRCLLGFVFDLVLIGFVPIYGMSTIENYLMQNFLYTYISNIWFGLIGFYGISTIEGYLIPNPFYTYKQSYFK